MTEALRELLAKEKVVLIKLLNNRVKMLDTLEVEEKKGSTNKIKEKAEMVREEIEKYYEVELLNIEIDIACLEQPLINPKTKQPYLHQYGRSVAKRFDAENNFIKPLIGKDGKLFLYNNNDYVYVPEVFGDDDEGRNVPATYDPDGKLVPARFDKDKQIFVDKDNKPLLIKRLSDPDSKLSPATYDSDGNIVPAALENDKYVPIKEKDKEKEVEE